MSFPFGGQITETKSLIYQAKKCEKRRLLSYNGDIWPPNQELNLSVFVG